MAEKQAYWDDSRRIVERIVVRGELVLDTPAHFGGGDSEGLASLSLLTDPAEGRALLPGASITGALRNYWRERRYGYGAAARDTDLFGAHRGRRGAMKGFQSLLLVDDALGPEPQVELRPGVKIRGDTRTAEEEHLYDVELLRAGTRFPLRFELLVDDQPGSDITAKQFEALDEVGRAEYLASRRQDLLSNLALAAEGFEKGEIGLGARKRRGFGRCHVESWQVRRYDLGTRAGLLAWLAEGRGWPEEEMAPENNGSSLAALLRVAPDDTDRRYHFALEATFALDGSLLVRSGFGEADAGPDMAHLHRPVFEEAGKEPADPQPVLPGTSLAGALRARAQRIANTLARDSVLAEGLVNGIFGVGPQDDGTGSDGEKQHWASRLVVQESVVEEAKSLVQTRIRIDRFTGGAMDGYLFSEAPVFGGENCNLHLQLLLRGPAPARSEDKPAPPADAEIGLLLLLLKDLWTGDLPVGGESSVGRGRLRGLAADVHLAAGDGPIDWHVERVPVEDEDKENGLRLTSKPEQEDVWDSLERYVKALNDYLRKEAGNA